MKIDPRIKLAQRQSKRGFTLLEMVVVVAILVVLTGILLPKFDVFKLRANKGVAASNMTDVSRIIQTYYAQYSVYPDRWDSLVTTDSTPTLWTAATPADQGLEPQLTGSPGLANPVKLTTMTLDPATADDAGAFRSMQRIGIQTVLDLNAFEVAPNERFTVARTIGAATGTYATLNPADEDAANIIKHIYPNAQDLTDPDAAPVIPDGKRLVVFGFGSHNNALGLVVQEIPFYPNTDVTKYYSRFLAVFEVDNGGGRAELKAVIGADGDPIFDELGDFFEH